MNSEIQNKRRKWYQRKYGEASSFRKVFTWYLIGICLLCFMLGVLICEYVDHRMLSSGNGINSPSLIDLTLLGLFFAAFLLAVFMGFTIKHRVFGPIHRIVKHMEAFGETGATTVLNLRKDDYFKDIAVSYNKMLTRIRDSDKKS